MKKLLILIIILYTIINLYSKNLTTSDLINLKCNQQYNKIRKNYADLRGLKYSMLPVYDNLPSNKERSNQNNTKKVGETFNSKNITRKRI
jgi:hypothetical protein